MNFRSIEMGGLGLDAPESWEDTTEQVEGDSPPLTLADPQAGVGALQFSPAFYKSGPRPQPTEGDLLSMVHEFAQQRELGPPSEEGTFTEGGVTGAGASFHSGEDFIRVWYVSAHGSFALVTYVCSWGRQHQELPLCERVVRSLRFVRAERLSGTKSTPG